MKTFLTPWVAACLLLAVNLPAQTDTPKTDPTGTWIWSTPGRNGGEPRQYSLTLKADGEKLTGKLISPARGDGEPTPTEISEGKVKDGQISFKVKRDRQGNTLVTAYAAKITGDTLTGTIGMEREGQTRSREWTAKRKTPAAKE